MTKPKDWRTYERHPISAGYPDLKGQAWEDFLDNLKKRGIRGRSITLYEGKILDGWQLYRACLELDIEPTFSVLREGEDPEEFVDEANDHRRHESAEKICERAEKRRERVAKSRAEGKSRQAIAEAEGVSETQVRRDEEASVSPPGETDGQTTGKDGKTYPASKPKVYCTHCQTLIRKSQEPKTNCPMCRDLRKTGKKREKKEDPAKVDAFGTVLPARCKDAYCDPWIQDAIDFIGVTVAEFWKERLADGMSKRKKHYPWFNVNDFADGVGMAGNTMEQLLKHLKDNRPAGVCPSCEGSGCTDCRMSGLVPREEYKKLKGKKK